MGLMVYPSGDQYPSEDLYPGQAAQTTTPDPVIDYSTPVGRVRLLIADVGSARQQLTDEQLLGFLAMYAEDPTAAQMREVRLAAADACEALGTSEVLRGKVVRTADGVTIDASKVSAELRARAAALRDRVAVEDAEEIGSMFDVTPYGRY